MEFKTKVKEFVKEHKKAIEIGCKCIAIGVTGVAMYKYLTGPKWNVGWKFKTEKEADECLEAVNTMLTIWKESSDGAEVWDTVNVAGFDSQINNGIFTDVNGETMKITNMILFGNKVET